MSVGSGEMPKYQVQAFDARGLVIGDDNTIYQYIVADPRFRILADRLYTFTVLIEEKTRAYVGRRFVFDAFDKFMKQNDRGYFIVQGEPGIGKTALVAQLVRTRGYVHHFLIATQGIVKVEQFVQNVTLQLMARYRMEPLPGHFLGIVDSGLLRRPMKPSTCSDHAVHSSERSDASKIIVHQVVGMDKGDSVLRRDSPLRVSR